MPVICQGRQDLFSLMQAGAPGYELAMYTGKTYLQGHRIEQCVFAEHCNAGFMVPHDMRSLHLMQDERFERCWASSCLQS